MREGLTKVFKVMDPDEFEANIDDVKRRIDDCNAEIKPGERETWLDFEFYPAVQDGDLNVYVRCRRRWPNSLRPDRADRLPAAHVAQLQLGSI